MTTKVGLVTGGAEGIGKGIATALLADGYKVGILDINETKGKQTADEFSSQFGSGCCVFSKCDVTQTEQLKESYEKVEITLGKLDIVVNNAGILTEVNWKKMIDVNLKGMIDSTYIAIGKMRKDNGGKGGTIVNVSSEQVFIQVPGLNAYASTKWGILGFTKNMAASLAAAGEEWGLSIVALCPGKTVTAIGASLDVKDVPTVPKVFKEQLAKMAVDPSVRGIFMSPDELATGLMTLLKDGKNGDALLVERKEKGGPVVSTFVEQKWNI